MAMHIRMPHVSRDDVILVAVALGCLAIGFTFMVNLPAILEFVAAKAYVWAQEDLGYTYR